MLGYVENTERGDFLICSWVIWIKAESLEVTSWPSVTTGETGSFHTPVQF